MERTRVGTALTTAAALALALTATACAPGEDETQREIAPGVEYVEFTGPDDASGHMLVVDLDEPGVRLDVLNTGEVTGLAEPSVLAADAGATGVVNGDYFNWIHNSNGDAGYQATNGPVGPTIANGVAFNSAVPGRQRYGANREALPEEYRSNQDVFGVTLSGAPVATTVGLHASAATESGVIDIGTFNSYAVPVDGVGLFTPEWGDTSRERARCGDEGERRAERACDGEYWEVRIRDGAVVSSEPQIGDRHIEANERILLARGESVSRLQSLAVGDPVEVEWGLESADGNALQQAIGGLPIVAEGSPVDDLDQIEKDDKPRTAVGFDETGDTLYMVVIGAGGASLAEMAEVMVDKGAYRAVGFDGGGSSTLATYEDGAMRVQNEPSDGAGPVHVERAVANALAVFSEPVDDASSLAPTAPPGANRWSFQLSEVDGERTGDGDLCTLLEPPDPFVCYHPTWWGDFTIAEDGTVTGSGELRDYRMNYCDAVNAAQPVELTGELVDAGMQVTLDFGTPEFTEGEGCGDADLAARYQEAVESSFPANEPITVTAPLSGSGPVEAGGYAWRFQTCSAGVFDSPCSASGY
ncbi:phosphodiester glycosidase family protein [Glycomyces sp. MUSA5-2]|uniref:phosphodiester glycosidase family protein n=1 Tax=Glycomyces sp. MUSA5-2 TaxID=2053002 RepID=UPI00300B2115